MNNTDLRTIENNLNQLLQLRNQVDNNMRSCTPEEYMALNNDITNLMAMRNELINSIQYGNRSNLYNQPVGYTDQRWQQPNNMMYNQRPSFAMQRNMSPASSIPSVLTTNNVDDGDNKFAAKANSRPVSIQPVQQQKQHAAIIDNSPKPAEGSEYILNTSAGLECRKEVKDGLYRYEVYGNIKSENPDNLKFDTIGEETLISSVKKHCLTKKLDGCWFTLTSYKYGNGVWDEKSLNNKIKTGSFAEAMSAVKDFDLSISKYFEQYYTPIFNIMLTAGIKRTLRVDSVVSDFEEVNQMILKEPIRLQKYYENIKESIVKDVPKNVSVKLDKENDLYTVTHNASCLYIESPRILGNLNELMKDNHICCVKEESNPSLFKVLVNYFTKNKEAIYTILYHMDNVNVVSRYIACEDIHGNFILSK